MKLKLIAKALQGASRYSGDPFWMVSKYGGKCTHCHKAIAKGEDIFYFPKTRAVFCEKCGAVESAKFDDAVHDEDFSNHGGGYY